MNSSQSPESEPLSVAEERRRQQRFRDGATDYLADAGFSARVLGHLPVARHRREWRRRWLVGGAVLLGGAAATVCGGHDLVATLSAGWAQCGEWIAYPVPGLEAMATVGSVVVLVGSLGVAWWSYARAE